MAEVTASAPDGPVPMDGGNDNDDGDYSNGKSDGRGEKVLLRQWFRPGHLDEDWDEIVRVLKETWRTQGPFDGVWGFSNGAAVASLLARYLGTDQGRRDFPWVSSMFFFVLAGGYDPLDASYGSGAEILAQEFGRTPNTVHAALCVCGDGDMLVPASASIRAFEATFGREEGAGGGGGAGKGRMRQVYRHAQGHCVPSRRVDVEVYLEFLTARRQEVVDAEAEWDDFGDVPRGLAGLNVDDEGNVKTSPPTEAQREEVEAMEAIYGERLVWISSRDDAPLAFRVDLLEEEWCGSSRSSVALALCFPAGYPEENAPVVALRCMPPSVVPGSLEAELLGKLRAEASGEAMAGMPMAFAMVETAKEFLADHAADLVHDDEENNVGKEDKRATVKENEEDDDDDDDGVDWSALGDRYFVAEGVDTSALVAAAGTARVEARQSCCYSSRGMSGSKAGTVWSVCLGLVGKPSAGKSTFFNAAVQPEDDRHAARMAAFPFTTIRPNFGEAYVGLSCPCSGLSQMCDASDGHVGRERRRYRITVKDVAGLVPGAFCGKGRGNAFLNDLVDADALVHVVDASGETDREGNPTGGGGDENILLEEDLDWIEDEVHLWIFSNIFARIRQLRKRPHKLPALFSGYRASRSLVAAAFASAGLPEPDSGCGFVRDWPTGDVSAPELHRLVAHFVRLRFPILVALNKADAPRAPELIKTLQHRRPDLRCVPMCARGELLLQRLSSQGNLSYAPGDGQIGAVREGEGANLTDADVTALEHLQRTVLPSLGSTGVQDVLTHAVGLCGPVQVFPVLDFETLRSPRPRRAEGKAERTTTLGSNAGTGGGVLEVSALVRPGCTVENVVDILKHSRDLSGYLEGDFVRGEACAQVLPQAGGPPPSLVRRDAPISRDSCVLRLATTKKSQWQQQQR